MKWILTQRLKKNNTLIELKMPKNNF